MSEKRNSTLVDGIIVMSNPIIIFGVIALMLLMGWLKFGELAPLLGIIAVVYLGLSVLGGHLAKRRKQTTKEDE